MPARLWLIDRSSGQWPASQTQSNQMAEAMVKSMFLFGSISNPIDELNIDVDVYIVSIVVETNTFDLTGDHRAHANLPPASKKPNDVSAIKIKVTIMMSICMAACPLRYDVVIEHKNFTSYSAHLLSVCCRSRPPEEQNRFQSGRYVGSVCVCFRSVLHASSFRIGDGINGARTVKIYFRWRLHACGQSCWLCLHIGSRQCIFSMAKTSVSKHKSWGNIIIFSSLIYCLACWPLTDMLDGMRWYLRISSRLECNAEAMDKPTTPIVTKCHIERTEPRSQGLTVYHLNWQ